MTEEIWKPVRGYEDAYYVSSFGRVRTKDRIIQYKNGQSHRWPEHNITASATKNGYLTAMFWKNNIGRRLYVHRIVAETFIPNPENKPQINHKNGIKTDNRAENLEWCTASENVTHRYKELKKPAPKGRFNKLSTPVLQYKNNVLINEFSSIREAQEQTGCRGVSEICRGLRKSSLGFQWKYKK